MDDGRGSASLETASESGEPGTETQRSPFEKLIEIGIALSAERNRDRLLETILVEAKAITNADGGTLYLRTDDDHLKFAIMRTTSLGIAMGGTTGKPIPFPALPLKDPESGEDNNKNIATYVALAGETINIPDAYETQQFDFSGTKKFDSGSGYRSKSILTVPLKNYEGNVIGVLQLLNARDRRTAEVIPFPRQIESIVEALASQAAVALDNQQLLDGQKELLESFIKLIAYAIDRKSRYTGGHCERVPILTEMLAAAACRSETGPFKDFQLNDDEWYELRIAGWMHDCGKVTTPEYVMDKATKLETIYDRIETVKARFEVAKRDREIEYLKALAEQGSDPQALKADLDRDIKQITDDAAFIERINSGSEWMPDDQVDRLERIKQYMWRNPDGETVPLLTENEAYNLEIRRGTLNAEERQAINDHIVVTIEMLETLPFPKNLKRVPEYAGGHHEKMDGTGYPKGLTRDQLSVPARMMAIADIFEALTAADRPYKKPKPLSESVGILKKMAEENHIDTELFELFVASEVHKEYAERFLAPEQNDEVYINAMLGAAAE